MRKLAMGLAVAASALAAAGCSKKLVQAPPPDAGTTTPTAASRPAYTGPFEPHVVARTLSWRTQILPLASGKILLDAGIFEYELTADGTAVRLGDLASYAKKMPAADDQLTGYEIEPTAGLTAPDHKAELRESSAGTQVPVTDVGLTPHEGLRCEHLASSARPHVLCRSWASDDIKPVYRREGSRWERVTIADDVAKHLRTGAVGADGALWLGTDDGKVVRISAAGVVDSFALPAVDAKLVRASYWANDTYGRPKIAGKADDDVFTEGIRRFEQVGISPAPETKPITLIQSIVPRADGEAWVLAGEGHAAHVLVHMSRPAIAPLAEPVVVGSEVDQRNELRNLRPPITWVGHCPQLFVALAKQRIDGSLASESVWSNQTSISTVVKKAFGARSPETPSAALVEGRLGGRRVAGLLLWRGSPASSEELLEKSTTAIAAELSTGTGLPPEITCTAPVLERAANL